MSQGIGDGHDFAGREGVKGSPEQALGSQSMGCLRKGGNKSGNKRDYRTSPACERSDSLMYVGFPYTWMY